MNNIAKQLSLLENIYEHARSIYRYNGIDKQRTDQAYEDLMNSTYEYQIWLENSNDE